MYYSQDKELNKLIEDEVISGARFAHGKKHAKLFLAGGACWYSRAHPVIEEHFRM